MTLTVYLWPTVIYNVRFIKIKMVRNYNPKKGRQNKNGNYTPEQFDQVQEALKTHSLGNVSKTFNIAKATIHRWNQYPNMRVGTGKKTAHSS